MDSNTKPKTSQLASQQQDRPPQQDQEEKKSQKPLIKPLLPGRANEPGSEASPAVISSDPVSDKDAAQVINTVSAAMAIPPVPKPPHTGPANPNQHVPDPLAHFLSIPWTAALLTNPGVLAIQVPDRRPLVSGGFRMMRKALNGPRTVRACVTFVTNPQREEQDSGEGRGLSYLLSGGGPEDGEDPARPFVLFHVLLDLGEDVCSYPGVMHGGAVSLMLDEAMASAADTQSKMAVTASITTRFRKPIKLPAMVQGKARVVKRTGRKIFVRGLVEDEHGSICAEAESVLVDKEKPKHKL